MKKNPMVIWPGLMKQFTDLFLKATGIQGFFYSIKKKLNNVSECRIF